MSDKLYPENTINELDQPIGYPVPDWRSALRPGHGGLSGHYCRLEISNPAHHAAALHQAFAERPDSRDWTYLPYGPFDTVGRFENWLTQAGSAGDPLFFTIFGSANDAPIGLASYLNINPEAGSIEVGHIHYSPALQQTPAATEAMFLMMQHAFDECGYRRYEWKCDALNARSRRAAQRLGFRFEGVFRQATVYKGRNRDTAWFSITDHEWPKIRDAFGQWLSPSNFDSDGRQRDAMRCARN